MVVLGPRQCGKTTQAKRYLADDSPGGLYLDLERPRDQARLTDADLFLSAHVDSLVCLDEVQRRPDLFPLLRSLIDDAPRPGRFLLLGSAAPDLARHQAESLAGRVATLELSPFSVAEVVSTAADVERHWLRGGFPRSYLAPSDAGSYRWRREFVQTFLERDLGQLGIRTSPEAMGRFWRMIAHHHGQVLNLSRLANALDVSHTTVRTRVDEMVSAYMLRLLPPVAANLGKRLVKSPKVYVRDSGLLHALLDIQDRDALFAHPVFGASWEGYVIEQALTAADGWRASFYRTAKGVELDLVLERGQRRIGIECKASSAPGVTAGLRTAISDLQLDAAFVVAPVAATWQAAADVTILPVAELAARLA